MRGDAPAPPVQLSILWAVVYKLCRWVLWDRCHYGIKTKKWHTLSQNTSLFSAPRFQNQNSMWTIDKTFFLLHRNSPLKYVKYFRREICNARCWILIHIWSAMSCLKVWFICIEQVWSISYANTELATYHTSCLTAFIRNRKWIEYVECRNQS